MFCGKCGAQNSDDAVFCVQCGAQFGEQTPVAPKKPAASNKNQLVGIAAVAGVALVLLVLIFALFGGRSYKSTAIQFCEATFSADAKKVVSLLPKKVLYSVMEEEGYKSSEVKKFIAEGNEELEDARAYIKLMMGDMKMKYKYASAVDVTGENLKYLREEYKEMGVKISAAKRVNVDIVVKIAGEEMTQSYTIPVIKVGRTWYVDTLSLGGLF